MEEKPDMATLLRRNPKAAKHVDMIKEATETLRKLRESGVRGDGYTLVEPYGPRSIGKAPRTRSLSSLKQNSKKKSA